MFLFIYNTLTKEIGGDIIFWLREIRNRIIYSDESTIAAVKRIILIGISIINFPVAPGFPNKKKPDKSFKHR